jgi:hypothetical protein
MTDARAVDDVVAAAWRRVLLVVELDPQRGFLSHGGSSLATLQVAAAIGAELELSDAALDEVLMTLVADAPLAQVAAVAAAARQPT